VKIAGVEVSTNGLHIHFHIANGMGRINKDLVNTFLSANLDQFTDRHYHTGHGGDVVNHCQTDLATWVAVDNQCECEQKANMKLLCAVHSTIMGSHETRAIVR
jgi:hypothetical protein